MQKNIYYFIHRPGGAGAPTASPGYAYVYLNFYCNYTTIVISYLLQRCSSRLLTHILLVLGLLIVKIHTGNRTLPASLCATHTSSN